MRGQGEGGVATTSRGQRSRGSTVAATAPLPRGGKKLYAYFAHFCVRIGGKMIPINVKILSVTHCVYIYVCTHTHTTQYIHTYVYSAHKYFFHILCIYSFDFFFFLFSIDVHYWHDLFYKKALKMKIVCCPFPFYLFRSC